MSKWEFTQLIGKALRDTANNELFHLVILNGVRLSGEDFTILMEPLGITKTVLRQWYDGKSAPASHQLRLIIYNWFDEHVTGES